MLYDSIAITQGQIWLHLHWENEIGWSSPTITTGMYIYYFVYDKT